MKPKKHYTTLKFDQDIMALVRRIQASVEVSTGNKVTMNKIIVRAIESYYRIFFDQHKKKG